MNDWIEALKAACQHDSQRQVAQELGVSATMINQALKGLYKGDVERLRRLVEGRYMQRTVICPVLGEIAMDKCLWHQEREFAATHPQRVMLYRACRGGCEYSRLGRANGNKIEAITDNGSYDVETVIAGVIEQAGGQPEMEIALLREEIRKLAIKQGVKR